MCLCPLIVSPLLISFIKPLYCEEMPKGLLSPLFHPHLASFYPPCLPLLFPFLPFSSPQNPLKIISPTLVGLLPPLSLYRSPSQPSKSIKNGPKTHFPDLIIGLSPSTARPFNHFPTSVRHPRPSA